METGREVDICTHRDIYMVERERDNEPQGCGAAPGTCPRAA